MYSAIYGACCGVCLNAITISHTARVVSARLRFGIALFITLLLSIVVHTLTKTRCMDANIAAIFSLPNVRNVGVVGLGAWSANGY